jgi:hypothetical protein
MMCYAAETTKELAAKYNYKNFTQSNALLNSPALDSLRKLGL